MSPRPTKPTPSKIAWIPSFIDRWIDHLGLGHWTIYTSYAPLIDNDPQCAAIAERDCAHEIAQIVFRSDVDDTHDWHVRAVHELVHVSHSELDYYIQQILIPQLPPDQQAAAERTYRLMYEQWTQRTARCLYESLEVYPEELRH